MQQLADLRGILTASETHLHAGVGAFEDSHQKSERLQYLRSGKPPCVSVKIQYPIRPSIHLLTLREVVAVGEEAVICCLVECHDIEFLRFRSAL
jgi:hypothetical protein